MASLHQTDVDDALPTTAKSNEASYEELKMATMRLMRTHRAQRRTWCYADEADEHTVPNDGHGVTRTKPRFQIQRLAADELCGKRAPEEIVTGNTPDIQVDSQYVFS